MNNKALVLLSGGQDSASCLLWAINTFEKIECISFDYNQIHNRELDSGRKICEYLNISRKVIDVSFIKNISISSLLNKDLDVCNKHILNSTLPSSFLPGRNLLFLTIAAMYAYTTQTNNLIGGMCQIDYSGYPDCRDEVISCLEEVLNIGMEFKLNIHTPLMYLTKAESINLIIKLPNALKVLSMTHTCYKGTEIPCGECPACILRANGFKEAGIEDPIFNYTEVK
jgi:7-cyano-7-deazaguanine synthase